MKAIKIKKSAADAQAVGASFVEQVPHVFLREYRERSFLPGEAEERVAAAVTQLERALGAVTATPAVATALHALDGAIWDCAAAHEDRAWHAAWALAMGLKGGR